MGIKSLTNAIKKKSPNSIENLNLYQLSGKRVIVDASLIIYQQLLNTPDGRLFKNKGGKITNHITGLFYKIMNYISLNIELIFVFDGKPPLNKSECIQERKNRSMKAKEMSDETDDLVQKQKLERSSLRLTTEMINDVKVLLELLGIEYIHPEIGEGEAYASKLCQKGYGDYVLTEDMDTMAYACPKLIRNCVDRSIKRKDIISVINHKDVLKGFELTQDKFIDFCILCGCDYLDSIPKIGWVTALKLIKKYPSIDKLIKETEYTFPENYLEDFKKARDNFLMYEDINLDEIKKYTSIVNKDKLYEYLVNEIEMNPTRVSNTFKKFNQNYKK